MKKISTLQEKLKNYSLLAGSVLGTSFAAQGQVMYTDVVPDKQLGGVIPASYPSIESESIDLNNDGQFDFKISLTLYDVVASGFSFREEIAGSNFTNAVGTYSIEYTPFVFKINCGDSIPFGNNFYGFQYGNFAFQFPGNIAYNWKDAHDKYVGLKFKIGSDIHYGWLRVDVNTVDTVPNIILKSYAYEATANKKIEACDTGFAVGISHAEINSKHISIYPNPSTGLCLLNLEEPLNEAAELSVVDALGKEVFRSTIAGNTGQKQIPFNLSDLSSGIYFIQLKSEALLYTEKWVKH